MADPNTQPGASGADDRLETVLRAAMEAGANSSTAPAHGLVDARSRMLAGVERRRRRRDGLLAGGGLALVLVLAGLGFSGSFSGGGGHPVAAPQLGRSSNTASPLTAPAASSGTCRMSGSRRQYACGVVSEVTPSATTPSSASVPTTVQPSNGQSQPATNPSAAGPASIPTGGAIKGAITFSPGAQGTTGAALALRQGHTLTVRLPSSGVATRWTPSGIGSSTAGPTSVTVTRIGHDELRITAQRVGTATVTAAELAPPGQGPSCTDDCPASAVWTLNVEVTK